MDEIYPHDWISIQFTYTSFMECSVCHKRAHTEAQYDELEKEGCRV